MDNLKKVVPYAKDGAKVLFWMGVVGGARKVGDMVFGKKVDLKSEIDLLEGRVTVNAETIKNLSNLSNLSNEEYLKDLDDQSKVSKLQIPDVQASDSEFLKQIANEQIEKLLPKKMEKYGKRFETFEAHIKVLKNGLVEIGKFKKEMEENSKGFDQLKQCQANMQKALDACQNEVGETVANLFATSENKLDGRIGANETKINELSASIKERVTQAFIIKFCKEFKKKLENGVLGGCVKTNEKKIKELEAGLKKKISIGALVPISSNLEKLSSRLDKMESYEYALKVLAQAIDRKKNLDIKEKEKTKIPNKKKESKHERMDSIAEQILNMKIDE